MSYSSFKMNCKFEMPKHAMENFWKQKKGKIMAFMPNIKNAGGYWNLQREKSQTPTTKGEKKTMTPNSEKESAIGYHE